MAIVLHDLDDFQHVLSWPIATDVTIPLSPSKSITCYDFLNFLTKVFVVLNLEILMLLLLLFLLLREEIARLANLKKQHCFKKLCAFQFPLILNFLPRKTGYLIFPTKNNQHQWVLYFYSISIQIYYIV